MQLGTWNYEIGDLMESCSRHSPNTGVLILGLHVLSLNKFEYKLYKVLDCTSGNVLDLALGTVENHYRKVA